MESHFPFPQFFLVLALVFFLIGAFAGPYPVTSPTPSVWWRFNFMSAGLASCVVAWLFVLGR